MAYLLIVTMVFLVFCACLMAIVQNWLWFWLSLGVIAGLTWIWAVEHHWPRRFHIQHLRWCLLNLDRSIDKTSAEMADIWADDPGSDEWQALNTWLADLYMERVTLRHRIQDLTYKLGCDKF